MAREKAGRAANRWVWIGAAALVVLTPLAIWLGVFAPRAAKRARLEARLEQALRAYRGQRWERPVLRGEPIEGNAHEAQLDAVRDFSAIDTAHFDELHALLAAGGEPPASLRALVDDNAEALARYRASTQRRWAWGDARPELGLAAGSQDWLSQLRAGRLLLVSALGRPPGECLRICADTLRLAQDRAAGSGLVPLMIAAVHAEDVLVLAGRCLREADRDALEAAARELAILARHPAPTGSAMELEALVIGATLRMAAANPSSTPTDGWEQWRVSWDALEAWDLLMDDPASMRAIGDDYPADIDRQQRRQLDLASRDNRMIAVAMPDYLRVLRRDAAARAIVRLLDAAARIRLEHDAPPENAPALLSYPGRLDPTSGLPFAWLREGDEATLSSRTVAALPHGELALRLSWAAQPEGSVPDLLAEQAEAEGEQRDQDGGRDVDDREHGP